MYIATTILTDLSPATLIQLASVATGVGVLIGGVGVGGILMVPALIYLAGINVHTAIACCLFSYAFNGLVGAWLYARQGSIRWSSGIWLGGGAIPGAWIGATLVHKIASEWVVLIIAAFVIFAAVHSILNEPVKSGQQQPGTESLIKMRFEMPPGLLTIGLITGFGSALSGSGGPLILVPLLVWLKWPVLTAVGLGQLIQIPISMSADVANFQADIIDLPLALAIAFSMSTGVLLGARIAHRQPASLLRSAVNAALLFTAGWMILQSATGMLRGNY